MYVLSPSLSNSRICTVSPTEAYRREIQNAYSLAEQEIQTPLKLSKPLFHCGVFIEVQPLAETLLAGTLFNFIQYLLPSCIFSFVRPLSSLKHKMLSYILSCFDLETVSFLFFKTSNQSKVLDALGLVIYLLKVDGYNTLPSVFPLFLEKFKHLNFVP